MSEALIKEKLQALAPNAFRVSEDDDLSTLIPDMLFHIGSTDYCLRDELIYSAFATWILDSHAMSQDQLHELLREVLGERHMFHGIGEQNTDSVFRRSFSVLLLPLFLITHRSQPFLSPVEIAQVREKLLGYLRDEKDRRGFVDGKGWAHAIAHAADALDDLAQCVEIDEADLREMLVAIRSVVSIRDAVYTHGEDERLVTATLAVMKRGLLSDSEIAQWIRDFADPVLGTDSMPQGIMIRANVKNFLQSLYFRLHWEHMLEQFSAPIDQTLRKIGPLAASD